MTNKQSIINDLFNEVKPIKEDDSDTIFKISEIKKEVIIKSILENYKINDTIDVSNDVFKDTGIDKWVSNLPNLYGSKILMEYIIKNPINNKKILLDRQKTFIYDLENDFDKLKEHENDVLWIYTLDKEIKEDSTLNFLYFSGYIIEYINYADPLLDFYHYYKIFIIPFMALFYPISTLYAPYYYINKYMKFNMDFKTYITMIISCLKQLLKLTGNIKTDLIKIVSILIYVFIYVYNIYQTFVIGILVYKLRQKLYDKIQKFTNFLNQAIDIISIIPENMWRPFNIYNDIDVKDILDLKIENSISNVYRIWKSTSIKNKVSNILKVIYTIDIVFTISKLKDHFEWSVPKYVTTETKFWAMKNPLLLESQVSNPVSINKNIIITGPNAGGKTTYVKSIASNIILAQTIGITNCAKSQVLIYECINSFMRINDILGSKSYFEAETEYCANMINVATKLSKLSKNTLFLMDEPMHSTPPIEGMSTAYAVVEYLGTLPNIKLIITTHFHKLIDLEKDYPDRFINLSVNAEVLDNYNFNFTYKICKGFSKQCIAIELLGRQKFPQNVINSAIKMKNKICEEIYSSDNKL